MALGKAPAGRRMAKLETGTAIEAAAAAQSMRPSFRRFTMASPNHPALKPPPKPPIKYTRPAALPDEASERPCTRLRNAWRKVEIAYKLKLRKTPEATIHQSVGSHSTVHTDVRACGARCVSLAPRRGSSSINNAGTRSNAGAPASAIAARQP